MKKIISILSLFGSFATLFCCAMPILFVALGLGASFATITANIPQIYWILGHKNILFVITGILLFISYFLIKKSDNMPCPVDSNLSSTCKTIRPTTKRIFWTSIVFYIIGLSFSYIIPRFLV